MLHWLECTLIPVVVAARTVAPTAQTSVTFPELFTYVKIKSPVLSRCIGVGELELM